MRASLVVASALVALAPLPLTAQECGNIPPSGRDAAIGWLHRGVAMLKTANEHHDPNLAGKAFIALAMSEDFADPGSAEGGWSCKEAVPAGVEAFKVFTSEAHADDSTAKEIIELTFSFFTALPYDDNGPWLEVAPTLFGLLDDFGTRMGEPPSWLTKRSHERDAARATSYYEAADHLVHATALDKSASSPEDWQQGLDEATAARDGFESLNGFRDSLAQAAQAHALADRLRVVLRVVVARSAAEAAQAFEESLSSGDYSPALAWLDRAKVLGTPAQSLESMAARLKAAAKDVLPSSLDLARFALEPVQIGIPPLTWPSSLVGSSVELYGTVDQKVDEYVVVRNEASRFAFKGRVPGGLSEGDFVFVVGTYLGSQRFVGIFGQTFTLPVLSSSCVGN